MINRTRTRRKWHSWRHFCRSILNYTKSLSVIWRHVLWKQTAWLQGGSMLEITPRSPASLELSIPEGWNFPMTTLVASHMEKAHTP